MFVKVSVSRGKIDEALSYIVACANAACGVKNELLQCSLFIQLGDVCYGMTQAPRPEHKPPDPAAAEDYDADITLPAITDETSEEAAEMNVAVCDCMLLGICLPVCAGG